MSNIFSQSDSPASQLQQTTQNYLDSWKNINAQTQLQTGLALSNSKDLKTRLQGSNLTNQAIQTSIDQRIQTNLNQTSSGNSFNWDQALNAIGGVGSQLGGTAGTVAQGIQKTGSYIKLASEAGKAGNMLGKAGGIGGAVGVAADTIGSFLPQKTEYEGPKGDITQTMDSVYDGISDAAMNFGPVGMLVGGIMKGGAMLGKGMNALGGGTSGMTSTDAILGSSFFNLTPVGLVNGFGGATTDTITKDNEAFETVGNSYAGSNQTVNDALTKSGKKYGLLSHGAMNKANREIAEAKRQQNIISNIADTTNTQNLLQQSMAGINTNKRKFQLQGGYNQASVLAAKHGATIPTTISLAQESVTKLAEFKKGGSIEEKNLPEVVITPDEEYNYFINSLPENLKDYDDSYRMKRLWELSGSPKDFNQARKEGVFSATGKYKKIYHAPSVVLNNETGEYEFLKSAKHPTIRKELDWYYSDDPEATEFRNQYDLDDSGYPWYKYVKKEIPEFKEGGSVNLLPEGALHARKHHMDVEGITEKGIPVIDRKGNQQAEIEHSEIIYRLEVTQKLEELYKIYYSNDSSQEKKDKVALEAGKLLVYETLHNTQDNVGLLQNT